MQNTEKSTALLKQQEQTLREAVHYAVDMAQKQERLQKWRSQRSVDCPFLPVYKRLKMSNLLTMVR